MNPNNSRIVVAFSQTSDPSANWNLYKLPGNPNNDPNSISDFPNIGLTKDELFITVNALYASPGYGRIWQIEKQDGYNGETLTAVHYDNDKFNGSKFYSWLPLSGGTGLQGSKYVLRIDEFRY